MLIGFAGKMETGKTTAAEFLIDRYGFEKMSFATPLKKAVADLFEWNLEDLNDYGFKETVDPYWEVSPREVLQKFGTEFIREMINPDFWAMKLESRLVNRISKYNIVIDDIRFEEEADVIHDHGGIVILLERKDPQNSSIPIFRTHISEIIDFEWDYEIQNRGDDLSSLYTKIERLLFQGAA